MKGLCAVCAVFAVICFAVALVEIGRLLWKLVAGDDEPAAPGERR